MESYPVSFPSPQASPYAWSVDMGVLRTPMDGGNSRQRRLYDVMPHTWTLEFVVPMAALYDWQNWVNQFAYDYFQMPLVSWLASKAGGQTSTHVVRFISNLEFDLLAVDVAHVRVQAEASPAQV